MTTVNQAIRRHRIRRAFWIIAIILLIALLDFLLSPQLGRILQGLSGPQLPNRIEYDEVVRLNEQQKWNNSLTKKFHHISQGTSTLPIPLSWLLALEEPASSVFTMPFRRRDKFADNDYLLRFGFIESEVDAENPHGLPVGFALTHYESLEGISGQQTTVGFNCAACHTAQLSHEGTQFIIEGGPAAVDLGLLNAAFGSALGQTLVSSRIPFFNGRFERFAKSVLGDDAYSDANVARLEEELTNRTRSLAAEPKAVAVVEGFSRLDALNRIGNQVFAIDSDRYQNYVAIEAPVNFPHIWTASWFNWVQYDGSIMQPLVRNTGEAMGVRAAINTSAPEGENRFSSSVAVDNLWWIEKALSGDSPPYPNKEFGGLRAPKWPQQFEQPEASAVAQGQELYKKHCEECHLPPLNTAEIWSEEFFRPITWYDKDNVPHHTKESLLQLKMISLAQVGTDPKTADTMTNRTVDTAGNAQGSALEVTPGMGINTEVCTWSAEPMASPWLQESPPNFTTEFYSENSDQPDDSQNGLPIKRLVNITITDNPDELFGLSLGALVRQVNDEWFAQNFIDDRDRATLNLDRPNCLQVGEGYKARPHDGIWATAPFLHNGSVPTIYDLLSPVEERPKYVLLGNIEFDPDNLGLKQPENLNPRNGEKYTRDGYFILDTSIPGNWNTGHEFKEGFVRTTPYGEQNGLIGPALSHQDRMDLIAFLKTL